MKAACLWYHFKYVQKLSPTDFWLGMAKEDYGKSSFNFVDRVYCESIVDEYLSGAMVGVLYNFAESYFEMRRRMNDFKNNNISYPL